ncbi:MAG TPA: hypothetical protein P5110_06920 [Candidatus Omnitrophota bacterium]|nr:hypothetical protein [Candidatus Omnitrophota bacterium]
MAEQKLTTMQKIKAALIRALRLGVAQIPFIVTVLQGQANPKMVALGVFINATMKFLRDVFPSLTWIPL